MCPLMDFWLHHFLELTTLNCKRPVAALQGLDMASKNLNAKVWLGDGDVSDWWENLFMVGRIFK